MSGPDEKEITNEMPEGLAEAGDTDTEKVTSEGDGSCSYEEAIAEALVFASGEPVKLESIAIAIKSDKRHARKVMEKLMSEYDSRNGGIILRQIDQSFTFCSKPSLKEELRDYFEKPSSAGLSRAAMETLAIIGYNQPITRSSIEFVRGVNSDGVLVRLIEKGLVEEVGRADSPGRPVLYGTTTKFLQAMGVENLSQLPKIEKIESEKLNPVKSDENKTETEG